MDALISSKEPQWIAQQVERFDTSMGFPALPASFFWEWTRPYVVVVTLSAFVLWQLWGGACPVTLTENAARVREGLPMMPPEDGFVPDVLARLGIVVPGRAVTVFLYSLGFSLCGWFALTWTL